MIIFATPDYGMDAMVLVLIAGAFFFLFVLIAIVVGIIFFRD
jgi:hypothetical protein